MSQDALFNMVTILTNQKIHLLGMMTEAIHTPFLSDRFLAIQNAQYIFNTMKDLGGEIVFKEGGIMQQRADQVLHQGGRPALRDRAAGHLRDPGEGHLRRHQAAPGRRQGAGGRIPEGPRLSESLPGTHDERGNGSMSSGLYQIRDKDLDTTLDLTKLRPYGDTMNDAKVQMSFTLPVKDDDKGAAAAVQLAQKMGIPDPNVALRQKLDENFTF